MGLFSIISGSIGAVTVAAGPLGNYVFLLARCCFRHLTGFRRLGSIFRTPLLMMIPFFSTQALADQVPQLIWGCHQNAQRLPGATQ